MTETRVGSQTIRYDRDATAAVYRTLERGSAKECGCIFCKNFAAQRDPGLSGISKRCLINRALIQTRKLSVRVWSGWGKLQPSCSCVSRCTAV